ncbi:MAG: nuclear transport factor 2 family protein, partial [Dehalococcoidia bacterium]
ATRTEVTERFLQACNSGDLEALMQILAPGVTFIGDSGGRVRAPRRPIEGVERVIRVLTVTWAEPIPDRRIHVTTVNGGPGLVVTSGDMPVAALTLGIADGRVQAVYLVANPDKLAGVRP